ncbi:hypothetical protein CAL7102_08952 [Dulcicalothrix desertica PCC 7102]|nr:hypothetical protein CAL7102_08952 [Dulcicalothrix desertica PCC 7102]
MSYECLYTGERKIKLKKLNILLLKQDECSFDNLVSYQNSTVDTSLKGLAFTVTFNSYL